MLRHGRPRFRTLEAYIPNCTAAAAAEFALRQMNAPVDEQCLSEIREQWTGPLLVKGVLHPEDAAIAVARGADGIIVSNHGARQFDGAPSPIDVLAKIRTAVGPRVPLLLDSGVECGLDVVRAILRGADFVLLGRAFLYGLGALGAGGGDHVCNMLKQDLSVNLKQLGAGSIDELRSLYDEISLKVQAVRQFSYRPARHSCPYTPGTLPDYFGSSSDYTRAFAAAV